MAVTTTPRVGLTRWSAGTDPLRRSQLDTAMANIEKYLMRAETPGTLAARPAAGIVDRYYYATDVKCLYRDTGAAWEAVGSDINGYARLRRPAGHVGDLYGWVDGTNLIPLAGVANDGSIYAPNLTGGKLDAPYANLRRGSVLPINPTVTTKVSFTAIREDSTVDQMASLATNSITVPVAGVYYLELCGTWANDNDGRRYASIDQGGVPLRIDERPANVTAGLTSIAVSTMIRLPYGAVISASVWHNAGNVLNILDTNTENVQELNLVVAWQHR